MADTTQIQNLIRNLQRISRDADAMKKVIETVHDEVHKRIFDESGTKDINNISLGNYTDSYLKRRIKKGRGTNPKVRLQWSQTLSNHFILITLPSRPKHFRFGSGWMNSKLGELSEWLEEKYKKELDTYL